MILPESFLPLCSARPDARRTVPGAVLLAGFATTGMKIVLVLG